MWAERHRLLVLFALWAAISAWLVWQNWGRIRWFALSDTDDNLRIAQVRAWLAGQGWFDLRQYRLSPPAGFDIHWSRLVDLPIAGLIVALKPFLGGAGAERWASALAPLLPLGATLAALAVIVGRTLGPRAFWLGPVLVLAAPNVLGMMAPLRIDHHGWQLAALAWLVAGLVDPRRTRGAVVAASATAVSLTIGLELMPYLTLGAAAIGLRWVIEGGRAAPALRAYGATLALGSALGFVVFASIANRAPVCDALSPVWLTATISGGALFWAMSIAPVRSRWLRLAIAVTAGIIVAAVFALLWPHCLGRPEGVSPELDRLWLSNVREARSIFRQKTPVALGIAALPVVGLIGGLISIWAARRTSIWSDRAVVTTLGFVALALLAWQTRAAPAAQLLAIPGAAALAWLAIGWVGRLPSPPARIAAATVIFLLISGVGVRAVNALVPGEPPNARLRAINRANARCPTLAALRPIARLPATTVFTFVDLGPRLIAVTRHRAVAGPYHRNGDAILSVHHAFDGSPGRARAIMRASGARLLLVCPNMSESTIYRARSPMGFYGRLARNERFDWLQPVPLPKNSPYRLWRID